MPPASNFPKAACRKYTCLLVLLWPDHAVCCLYVGLPGVLFMKCAVCCAATHELCGVTIVGMFKRFQCACPVCTHVFCVHTGGAGTWSEDNLGGKTWFFKKVTKFSLTNYLFLNPLPPAPGLVYAKKSDFLLAATFQPQHGQKG